MILEKLKLLCQNAYKGEAEISEELIEEFGELCKASLRKQFTPNKREFKIRVSQIGKSLRQQQCELLDCETDEEEPYNTILKFLYGDVVEAILVVLLKASGTKIQELSKKVKLPIGGIEIEGELDVKINDKIYDIKSASPFSYDNKFSRGFDYVNEVDNFGYVTQLYLYAEAEKCGVGGWIVMNKINGEVQVVEPPIEDNKYKVQHLQLAETNIKALLATTSLDDVAKDLPSVPELFYKKPTGRRVLDSRFTYFPYKNIVWPGRIEYKGNPTSKAKVKPKKYYVKGKYDDKGKQKYEE